MVAESCETSICKNENMIINLKCSGKGTNKGRFTYMFAEHFTNADLWKKGFKSVNKEISRIQKQSQLKENIIGEKSYNLTVKSIGTLRIGLKWDYSDNNNQILAYKLTKI